MISSHKQQVQVMPQDEPLNTGHHMVPERPRVVQRSEHMNPAPMVPGSVPEIRTLHLTSVEGTAAASGRSPRSRDRARL